MILGNMLACPPLSKNLGKGGQISSDSKLLIFKNRSQVSVKTSGNFWNLEFLMDGYLNSYPGKCILEGTTFERVEPPCIIFVVLVEAVPEGISPHFQVLLLQGGRKFFKS